MKAALKVAFVFPLAKNRDSYLQINHIQNLKRSKKLKAICYPEFTNDFEKDLYENRDQSIWELIRQARETGQKKAYDDGCDWIIHHDYGELFHDDYLIRLEETLNSGMSYHYADFSYFSRFNKYQVIQPYFRINRNNKSIEIKPFAANNYFWEKVWQGKYPDRYYQVRRGSSWIWNRLVLEFLNFEIKPQSEEIRRHDSNWREYLFEQGFKCVIDTRLRKIDNTDLKAIEYYN